MLHLESPWDSDLPAAQAKSTNNLHNAAVLSLSLAVSLTLHLSLYVYFLPLVLFFFVISSL